ncbi:MAG: DNA polymerase III subunit chi [Gammaproteobacteria bacterium]
MPRIDFYVLSDPDALARLLFACRLAEKAYRMGRRVHLHADSEESAKRLDELLWTFRDRGFVPHGIAPAAADDYPVTIGHGGGHDWTPPRCDVLINLDTQTPAFFDRFERVAEIVDSAQREAGRARYRFYRERGCELSHHALTDA